MMVCNSHHGTTAKHQPRQIGELVPKQGAISVAWAWFGYEKSDIVQKTVQIMQQTGLHQRHRHNEPLLPLMQQSRERV